MTEGDIRDRIEQINREIDDLIAERDLLDFQLARGGYDG